MPAANLSEASICNLALGLIGQRQFLIDSLEEQTTEAIVAKTFYATTRDALLARWPWRFATKRQKLALTQEARTEWAFAYVAPADHLTLRYVIRPGVRRPGAGQAIPFTKELNDAADGHLVLTDLEAAEMSYTVRLTTVALFSSGFVTALAAQLALPFAGALKVAPQMFPMLQSAAQLQFTIAASTDANEASQDPEPESEFIRVR